MEKNIQAKQPSEATDIGVATSNGVIGSSTILNIEPPSGWNSLELRKLWSYRELLYFFVWRDVKVLYKQTSIGIAWAILQPLIAAVILTVIFSIFTRIPTGEIPYPIFLLAGLLPWTYFSRSLDRAGNSLVQSAELLQKVYFPRMLTPLSSVLSGLIDLLLAFVPLIFLIIYFGIKPTIGILLLPAFILLAVITAFGVGLWLSALNVYYRDIKHVIPFLVQIWFFATPIIYPVSMVPEKYRWVYVLNPMVSVVEGFRWALLGQSYAMDIITLASALVACILCITGLFFFRRMEDSFADVV